MGRTARMALRKRLMGEQRGLCALCREPMSEEFGPLFATLEHRVPVCRGGTNTVENLALAHKACNEAKGPLTEAEYLTAR